MIEYVNQLPCDTTRFDFSTVFTAEERNGYEMNDNTGFYTLKGYQMIDNTVLTAAMEDYLEMICRELKTREVLRVNNLADKLHVRPSSASKMVNNLKHLGYVTFEKYGYIKLTEEGSKTGAYLLYRHEVLHDFLCLLNNSENELEQVEKIEHFLNEKTIKNIKRITENIKRLQTKDGTDKK